MRLFDPTDPLEVAQQVERQPGGDSQTKLTKATPCVIAEKVPEGKYMGPVKSAPCER
jgi:hypothetical protein